MEAILNTEPTVTRNGRLIRADWLVWVDDDDKRHLLTLSVHHSPERKQFWASFGSETEKRGPNYTSRSFMLGGSVGIVRESVARYNARAADNFYLGAVAMLRTLITLSDEKVMDVIAKAQTQSTAP